MEKDFPAQLELFSDYLRSKGLRMTRQRELIARKLFVIEGHVSAEELYEQLRREKRQIGLATVFRTLKALTESGLARTTEFSDGVTRFEHSYKRPAHHHIVCIECGNTIEFFSPELERLQESIVSRYSFKPLQNRIQVYGVCRDCQDQRDRKPSHFDHDVVFTRDALKIAMETEKRGVAFYSTAAEIVSSEATRETFLEMLKDEEQHLSGLEREWRRLLKHHKEVLEAPVFLHFDFETLKRIFPSREEVQTRLDSDISEREALELALRMEEEARDFFRSYADQFADSQGRDVFLRFSAEEEEHVEIIRAALRRLDSSTL